MSQDNSKDTVQVSPDTKIQSSPNDEETDKTTVVINSSPESSPETEKSPKAVLDPAMAGRVSALEKERNEYDKQLREEKKKSEELAKKAKVFDTINEDFQNDPEAYEKWRNARKKKGNDPGTYESIYGTPQTTNPSYSQGNINVDPNYIDQLVNLRIQQNTAWNELKQEIPDLDPSKAKTQEALDDLKKVYQEIDPIATSIIKVRPNMSLKEAMKNAYYAVNHDKLVQSAEETGEAIGRQDAYAAGAGSFGSISGGTAKRTSEKTGQMTKYQLKVYEDLKAENPKIANRYEKIAQGL